MNNSQKRKEKHYILCQIIFVILFIVFPSGELSAEDIVNDITQLNPIKVREIIQPTSTEEIVKAIRMHSSPISIGGGHYSMGGQTAIDGAFQIDMRKFDRILHFSSSNKEITVQTGITWRKIQEFIDPYNLSLKIMQSYSNFTVGGSLSVNVHGRYIGQGSIILSVKQIKIILADGKLLTASPTQNQEIFYGAIGGYGGLGVITEATLSLTDNIKIERTNTVFPLKKYKQFFLDNIRDDSTVIFHNANIYPYQYEKVREISYRKTSKNLTINQRLKPPGKKNILREFMIEVISAFPKGKWLRQYLIDPILYKDKIVEWRNYEASQDLNELEPISRKESTYVLQEYFIPIEQFDNFYPLMINILKKNKVNVINISIRHAKPDSGSLLAWAQREVFAFVIYYKQGKKQKDNQEVQKWTRQLINAAILFNGTYYLPYQIHATNNQFFQAYPRAADFFKLKKQLDPTNKFTNKLWNKYYK